jgi:hypothetical protein
MQRFQVQRLSIGLLALSSFLFAQDPVAPPPPSTDSQPAASSNGGWKRVGDPADANQAPPPQAGPSATYGQPNYGGQPNGQPGQQPNYTQQPNYNQQPAYQPPPPPASLTIPRGTFLTVRVNQLLSSDKNQPGDAFSATLVQPLVVNGVVVAEPGQTIGGRVAEAQKAGHIEGTARLGIQLTELTLVDGQQLPIQSALVSRQGPTSVGRDAGAIATTTGVGAAIGAAADWGRGAAIGAGAGAAAGIIGVLVTRGHPSVIYPEQVLTFRIEAPLTISTERSPQAFRYVQPNEYDRPYETQQQPGPYASAGPYTAAPPPPAYYGGYPYPYYGSGYGYGYGNPYYWGPSFSLFVGPGYWWGGRYYRGGGFYGRGYVGGGFRGGGSFHGGGRR